MIAALRHCASKRLSAPRKRRTIPFRELQEGSVQLWMGKERDFKLPEIPRLSGVYRWNLGYDPFLGVMKGILPLLKATKTGIDVL